MAVQIATLNKYLKVISPKLSMIDMIEGQLLCKEFKTGYRKELLPFHSADKLMLTTYFLKTIINYNNVIDQYHHDRLSTFTRSPKSNCNRNRSIKTFGTICIHFCFYFAHSRIVSCPQRRLHPSLFDTNSLGFPLLIEPKCPCCPVCWLQYVD